MDQPRVLMVQLDASDPPARVGEWLIGAGAQVELCDVGAGAAIPAELAGYQGVVVLGGAMGANDDASVSFLGPVKALLRAVVRDEIPTLAICLGAQLLAAANGGRVHVDPDGPEIGAQLIAKRAAAATDPLFRELPITPDVIQWHFDTISELPPGAVHLASSPVCANEAFRLGRLAWGIQFHIETTPEIVRAWARSDAPRLDYLDLDLIVSRSDAAHDDIAEVWEPFLRAFTGVMRDPVSVPSARGIPVSVADPVTDPAAIRAALAAEAMAGHGSNHPGAATPLPMPTIPVRPRADPPARDD